MRLKIDAQTPLPLLRRDLVMYQGPVDDQGGPTYSIFDPLNDQYYKLSWAEGVIIQTLKPGMTLDSLLKALQKRVPLDLTIADLKSFFEDAANKLLLEGPMDSGYLFNTSNKRKPKIWEDIGSRYFYTRINIANPDRFLHKTLRFVKPFASPLALTLYAVLTLIGLFCIITRWEEYTRTFLYFFNFTGLIFYAIAISITKLIHEFAHAYTCRAFGARVPKMGVALIFLWPMLFTDVTDNWKLGDRWQRMAIAAAGTIAESVIAGIATIGWALAPEGPVQSMFFILSSVSWFSTLFVNLNPAQRFDGYYILSDYMGIENMQSRAFDVTCWKLKSWLLGLKTPCPEERLTPRREAFLIIYSFFTWAYRLFLYTLIAYMIYHYFPKVIALPLLALQLWLMFMKPVYNEVRSWFSQRNLLKFNWRFAFSTALLALLIGWFVLPYPHKVSLSGISVPEQEQVLYVPQSGWIESTSAEKGQEVTKGMPLVKIVSLPLLAQIKTADLEEAIIEKELTILSLDDKQRPFLTERSAALATIQENQSQLLAQQSEMTVLADQNGKLFDWNGDLKVGMPVKKDDVLGKIANTDAVQLYLFVPEENLVLVHVGQAVKFYPAGGGLPVYRGSITKIQPARDESLSHVPLASVYQGDLPVTQSADNKLHLIDSYYIAEVTLDGAQLKDTPLRFGTVGHAVVEGPWRSYAISTLRYIGSLFWRESGV